MITAIIEMQKGTKLKTELDKITGELRVDRELSIPVPHNYGFIPNTLADDGDALDVFIVSNKGIQPLKEVSIQILGVWLCEDNGYSDEKILAIEHDTRMSKADKLAAMHSIVTYLKTYKTGFEVLSYEGARVADRIIQQYTEVAK